MKLIPLILGLALSLNAFAVIFGPDDRVNTSEAAPQWQSLARSVPALVQTKRLTKLPSGDYQIKGYALKEFGLCQSEAFAVETSIANCSGSLIDKNKVLTAAHCLDEKEFACSTYSVVFDYHSEGGLVMAPEQVYSCKRILFRKFDEKLVGVDLAIIELDREVIGRTPIKLNTGTELFPGDPLTMIGYPLGISQKVVDQGQVLSWDKVNVSFKHDLDTFSVNSGSPIFLRDGKQVGVLVRGTGPNLENSSSSACMSWGRAKSDDFAEANDLSTLPNL